MPVPAHVSLHERASLGKDARRRASRSSHADWTRRPGRASALDKLEAQEVGRIAVEAGV